MSLLRNAYAVSLLLTALAVLVLGAAAWLRRREARGAAALAALSVAAAAWATLEGLWLAAGGGSSAAAWLQAQRAVATVTALALLAYALRATRLLARVAPLLQWAAGVLTAAVVALAFGPAGGLSLWRSFRPGTALGRTVTVAVTGSWAVAASVVVAGMVACALVLLAAAWLRGGAPTAARHGWTLFGVAMPVVAEAASALVAGDPGSGAGRVAGLSPGALLLAPAALAAAQGLLGGHRGLAHDGEDEPGAAAGVAPRELLDHLDQPVLLIGPGDTVRYANAAAGRLFRPPQGLAGAHTSELFVDVPALAAALTDRRRVVLELELRRGEAVRPVEAWLTPLFEASGRFAGTMVALADVAARRRAEAERDVAASGVRRGEALLEALQDALRGALRGEPLTMLLDIVATGACRALDLPHAALYLVDASGDVLERRVAVGGFEAQPESLYRRDEGLVGRVWASGRTQAVDELPPRQGLASAEEDAWAGTAIGVPVRDRGRPVGVLLAARKRGDWSAYSAGEISVLERFADLAAMAVRDAATRERARNAERELGWIDDVDALAARSAADTEVLDAALRAAREAAGFERAVVWLATEDGSELEARAWLGFALGPEGGERWALNGAVPLLEEVFRSGQEVVLVDGGPLPARYRPSGSAADAPLLSMTRPMVLPLAAGERVLGVLAVDDAQEGVALEARLGALRRVAARVAHALERGRLEAAAACLRERAAEAEARLEAASEQLETLIEALPVAYFEADLTGVVTRSSRALARLLGTAEEGLKGVRLADLSAPGAEQTLPELMGRALRRGRAVRGAAWALRRGDGATLEVEVSLAVRRDVDGAASGYVGMLQPRQE